MGPHTEPLLGHFHGEVPWASPFVVFGAVGSLRSLCRLVFLCRCSGIDPFSFCAQISDPVLTRPAR